MDRDAEAHTVRRCAAGARAARQMDIAVAALAGRSGGALAERADVAAAVPATRAVAVQELRIAVGHLICGIVEERLAPAAGAEQVASAS